jgi:hypothetical protein
MRRGAAGVRGVCSSGKVECLGVRAGWRGAQSRAVQRACAAPHPGRSSTVRCSRTPQPQQYCGSLPWSMRTSSSVEGVARASSEAGSGPPAAAAAAPASPPASRLLPPGPPGTAAAAATVAPRPTELLSARRRKSAPLGAHTARDARSEGSGLHGDGRGGGSGAAAAAAGTPTAAVPGVAVARRMAAPRAHDIIATAALRMHRAGRLKQTGPCQTGGGERGYTQVGCKKIIIVPLSFGSCYTNARTRLVDRPIDLHIPSRPMAP